VDAYVEPASQAEAEWLANLRRLTGGWRRFLIPGVFLVYLAFVGQGITANSRGAGEVLGFLILAAFATCYLAIAALRIEAARRRLWALTGLLIVLSIAELPLAHEAALVMFLYVTVVTVVLLGVRSAPIVLALAVVALLLPIVAWHQNLTTSLDDVTPIAIPVVALVTFGLMQVLEGARALADARTDLACLAAENERLRIARDLHDLLGHSLTTITVKAGLARQLGQSDPARALQEIAEVETLGRKSLADVRAAVTNYREVTLAGELATGRELLLAAGIAADLPGAVDAVDPTHQELFGWVVREGLTNVVRHSHARTCTIRLSESTVEIADDGVGGAAQPGSGLHGLRERVAAAGGLIQAGPLAPRGWRLLVSLAPQGSQAAVTPAPQAATR
jgi:two-component system sensor histidine kinase DesK